MVGMKNSDKNIPYRFLQSWMHKRIPLQKQTKSELMEIYNSEPKYLQLIEYFLTTIFHRHKLLRSSRVWAFHRVIMGIIHFIFKICNRTEIIGKENIPKEGAIFLINHIHSQDVVLTFMAAFKKPVGAFTDIGEGLIVRMAELIGIMPREGSSSIMVEKMIRQIALKNKYFAMWPEGTPDKGKGIMQAFSGIVKVYATLNSDKNRIPFVPVVMQDTRPNWGVKSKEYIQAHMKKIKKIKNPKIRRWKYLRMFKRRGFNKIVYKYLKPQYIPREWLKLPEEGGKTARFIIDKMMMKIADAFGQKKLSPNPVLDRRKKDHTPWH
jgi:1-acyl-sn-glycerol-3-phosphate acyltransferase